MSHHESLNGQMMLIEEDVSADQLTIKDTILNLANFQAFTLSPCRSKMYNLHSYPIRIRQLRHLCKF